MPQISRSLARYHQELSAINPGMDADTEFGLILRWQQHQDEAAKKSLLEAHLRFVIKRAKRYAGTKQQLEEYIAAGNLGLLEALNRYDVNRVPRWRFLTYAAFWIENVIHNSRYGEVSVHVPVYRQKAQRKAAKLHAQQSAELGLAAELEAPPAPEGLTVHLETILTEPGKNVKTELNTTLFLLQRDADEKSGISGILLQQLQSKLIRLPAQEQSVISMYFGLKDEPRTDNQIANFLFLTTEQVRQVRITGLERLRRFLVG